MFLSRNHVCISWRSCVVLTNGKLEKWGFNCKQDCYMVGRSASLMKSAGCFSLTFSHASHCSIVLNINANCGSWDWTTSIDAKLSNATQRLFSICLLKLLKCSCFHLEIEKLRTIHMKKNLRIFFLRRSIGLQVLEPIKRSITTWRRGFCTTPWNCSTSGKQERSLQSPIRNKKRKSSSETSSMSLWKYRSTPDVLETLWRVFMLLLLFDLKEQY